MNRICLPLLLSLLSIGSIDSIAFCDVWSFDNVFNVGHLIHMTRCGEVWTYDPRLKGDSGGFYKDYSWYAFAKRKFGANIKNQHKEYDDKYLRFAAFSFQNIECENGNANLERDCYESSANWTTLSVMVDNFTAVTFRYDYDIHFHGDRHNPLGFPAVQNMKAFPRELFWPDLDILGGQQYNLPRGNAFIHSALYSNTQKRLYMVLLSVDQKFFCFTHINMKGMLSDWRLWPKTITEWSNVKSPRYQNFKTQWAQAMCHTGSVVGMFEDREQVYVVGRISYESRVFEDQLYTLDATEGTHVRISPTYDNGGHIPRTLRTYFGCPVISQTRRKRSLQKFKAYKQTIDFSFKSIIKELKEDWLQLSVMSVTALVLLLFIIRFS